MPDATGSLYSEIANYVDGSTSDSNFPTALGSAFDLSGSDITASGTQLIIEQQYASGGHLDLERLHLSPTSVFSAGVSAAPEPATWSLMIVGVGILGLALRRREAIASSAI